MQGIIPAEETQDTKQEPNKEDSSEVRETHTSTHACMCAHTDTHKHTGTHMNMGHTDKKQAHPHKHTPM